MSCNPYEINRLGENYQTVAADDAASACRSRRVAKTHQATRQRGAVALLGLLFAFGQRFGVNNFVILVLFIFILTHLFMMGAEGVFLLINCLTAVDRTLSRGLVALETTDVPGLEPKAESRPPPPEDLPAEPRLYRVGAARAEISTHWNRRVTRRSWADILTYTFSCGDETFDWSVAEESSVFPGSSGLFFNLPAFRSRHDPFLAEGDLVAVYDAMSPEPTTGLTEILPGAVDRRVLCLFNYSDRSAYWMERKEFLTSLYGGWRGAG